MPLFFETSSKYDYMEWTNPIIADIPCELSLPQVSELNATTHSRMLNVKQSSKRGKIQMLWRISSPERLRNDTYNNYIIIQNGISSQLFILLVGFRCFYGQSWAQKVK